AFRCPTRTTRRFPRVTPCVDQVPLQHRIMLSAERDQNGWVFRALALVGGRRIGQHQLIQLAKAVIDVAPVEIDAEFALLHVDVRHGAEIAVVDVLVVIVLDLYDLVARTGPTEAFDADIAELWPEVGDGVTG